LNFVPLPGPLQKGIKIFVDLLFNLEVLKIEKLLIQHAEPAKNSLNFIGPENYPEFGPSVLRG
jgi:hypothetical protein